MDTDYPLEMIEAVLSQFPQTVWYAMEENCVSQAEFYYVNGELSYSEREVTQANGDNIMELRLEVEGYEYRAEGIVFLFASGQIVVEQFLENKATTIQLTSVENDEIQEYLNWLCQQSRAEIWGVCIEAEPALGEDITCYIHFQDYHVTFESPIYDDDEVDESASYHFTIFYQHLKQLIESKGIKNIL